MSTIIVITPQPKKPKVAMTVAEIAASDEASKIRVTVDDVGTLADRLRAAADALDGVP